MSLNPIRSDLLRGVTHAFFTREGGVSQGIYQGLNGGQGSADDAAAVAENRARMRDHLGASVLLSLHQVHSPDVVRVAGDWPGERPRADAIY